MPCGCRRGRRGACPPPGSPPRSGSRRTRRPSCRGACAAPWRDRSVSDVLSGGVEADDFLIAARDRTRRRGPRARGRCSRRPGTPRAGAGAAPPGSSRTAGPAAAQVRRGRARREPPHLAPRDLEPRVLGHRDVLRPVDGGAAVLTRTSSPGGTRIAGATPPRPWSPTAAWGTTAATSCTGRSSTHSHRPRRPGGAPGVGAGPASCDYEAHWGALFAHLPTNRLFGICP